jgi:hypothetical protein
MITPLRYASVSAVTVHSGTIVLTPWVSTMTTATKWDYKLNSDHGSLLFAPTASLDKLVYNTVTGAATALTVDYSYAAQKEADALTQPMQERFLRFEGLNTAETNDPVIVEVFKFSIDPLKELAMISDTFGQFVLDGSILRDALQVSGSKYFRQMILK